MFLSVLFNFKMIRKRNKSRVVFDLVKGFEFEWFDPDGWNI